VFDLMSVEDSGDGVSEIVVVRLQEAINAADQKFLRLKISRSSS
jgi:hypothetical protein